MCEALYSSTIIGRRTSSKTTVSHRLESLPTVMVYSLARRAGG